jgi:transketolase
MTMIVPADYEEARKATVAMGEMVGPAYIRFGRSPVPLFTTPDTPFQLGKANVVMDGTDVALIANGALVWESILAAKELAKKGISARVINVHTVKPFDVETVTTAARECGFRLSLLA